MPLRNTEDHHTLLLIETKTFIDCETFVSNYDPNLLNSVANPNFSLGIIMDWQFIINTVVFKSLACENETTIYLSSCLSEVGDPLESNRRGSLARL